MKKQNPLRCLLSICFLALTPLLFAQTTYFVSPNGRNKNNGTHKHPFQTIEKAKEMAHKTEGDVTIYIHQGIYRLATPLVFSADEDAKFSSLTICAYPNEDVVIAGGTLLNPTWESHTQEILKAKITPSIEIDMLIVNGKIRHMARYPNYDSTAVRFNGTSAHATSSERIKGWKNPSSGYLHAMHAHDWGDFHYRITGKDEQGGLKIEGGHQNNRRLGLSAQNRMVEHIFEELDAPGEWYYEASTSTLYYYPMPHEDIRNAKFEVPLLKHLIEFRGSEQKPVKNITIKGVELTQTTRTFMEKYEPLLRSDWTIYRGGAILFEGTENCGIDDCYLHQLGGNAVFFSNYNRNSFVSSSHITQIGASAICFVGDPNAVRSPSFEYGQAVPFDEIDRHSGPKTNNYPAYCTVYDNLIYKIGLYEKQITGVELSMCHSITVKHNSIYDTPRAGINISEGTWGGHTIAHNDVFDTVKETGDHGAFNSWGRDRFWHPNYNRMCEIVANEPSLILADAISTVTIRNNRFRCDRGWDIDLDDGSTNYHIYNNLCLNGGIKLREGFYRVVENNILINNTFYPHVWFDNSGDVFARNIVMSSYQPIKIPHWGKQVDYNIFTDKAALEAAKSNQTDANSISCLVEFRDAEQGDYRVKNSSTEVFRMGFHNFDMNRFGVVSPKLKQLARTPPMPLPIVQSESSSGSDFMIWQGWRIKNLETLGERSATGMDSERGVYVISFAEFDAPLRDYIRSNDVILKINEYDTNNMVDLQNALDKTDLSKPIEMVIFRNQKDNLVKLPANIIK